MILNSEELTLCLVPTSVLLEAGDVNDVDDLEKSTGKQSTKWKQAITTPDGLKIYGLMRIMSVAYALPVISEWEDTQGTKTANMMSG